MRIRIGTRGSQLALAQTDLVISELKKYNPLLDTEIIIIKTTGDKILNISLDKIGDKGLFVKEIEEQLLNGQIDIAIHSMKDMPFSMPKNLELLPVLKREDPRDVLITTKKINSIDELPEDAIIATGSKRRAYQLKQLIPKVKIKPIRGNVGTRIQKMIDLGYDGTVLAAAGIKRLGIANNDNITIIPLSVKQMIPAPAQGIIAAQFVEDNKEIAELLNKIVDNETKQQCRCERIFLKEVNGGCHLPLGAYLHISSNKVEMYGLFGNEDGSKVVSKMLCDNKCMSESLAIKVAHDLVKEVANDE